MSLLSLNAKDSRLRIIASKKYISKLKMRFYMNISTLTFKQRYYLCFHYLDKLKWALNAHSKIKNRCLVTGRSSFVLSYFRLTRMTLKNFSSYGWINGMGKGSW